jgi:hypothetical protein
MSRSTRSSFMPPAPHEHGAWVMLYVPIAVVAAASHPCSPGRTFLLVIVATAAYLAQHAGGLALRHREPAGARAWLAVYLAALTCAGLPLLLSGAGLPLLGLAAAAGLLFGIRSSLAARRRMDRSQWGELLGVGALALTGPACAWIQPGHQTSVAWLAWAGCTLFFGSGVFYVKMLLAVARWWKARGIPGDSRRPTGSWACVRDSVLYHGLVLACAAGLAYSRGWAGVALAAGFAPVVVRAFVGAARLSPRLPSLKAVGILETTYALWFTVFFAAGLR